MKDLNYIKIEKHGNDQWCFDRIAIKQGGSIVWEYNTSVDDHSSQVGARMHRNIAPGPVWLDDQSHDALTYETVFTDRQILYRDRSNHGPLDVEIKTCTIDQARDADSHSLLRIRWTHDGIIEPPQNVRVDYWPYNHVEVHRLAENTSIENLSLQLEDLGWDNICIQSVRVLANGHPIEGLLDHPTLFGNKGQDAEDWDVLPLKPIVVETGNRIGQLGRPIFGNYRQGSITAGFGVMPDATYPYCEQPRIATHDDIVRMVEAQFVKKGRSKHASFKDDDYVRVTRKDSKAAHVAMRFHADAAGSGDAKIWMEYDLHAACVDPNPDNADHDEREFKIVIENVEKSYDVPPLLDIAGWFVNLFGDFDKMVKGMIPDPPKGLTLGDKCPEDFSFDSHVNLNLDWAALKAPNAMCRADSADWAPLGKCH
jgi:hypothetical protein